MSARLALFDLDGTLVDSAPDLADAVNVALAAHGIAALPQDTVRGYIGNGAARLIHRAVTGDFDGEAEPALFNHVYEDFLTAYDARVFVRTQVYDGVTATLQLLRAAGWRLACVTNKPARFTEPLLARAGLARLLDLAVSGDTLPVKKPDPEPLLHAARSLGVAVARSVMVGDSVTDLGAARNAGMPAVCVSFGYHGGEDLAAHGALEVIDHMAELPALLERVVGGAA